MIGSTGKCEVSALGGINLGERHVEFLFVAKQRLEAAAA
jgi:UDP-N-acetylglucosamine enolpyruvyl transferase